MLQAIFCHHGSFHLLIHKADVAYSHRFITTKIVINLKKTKRLQAIYHAFNLYLRDIMIITTVINRVLITLRGILTYNRGAEFGKSNSMLYICVINTDKRVCQRQSRRFSRPPTQEENPTSKLIGKLIKFIRNTETSLPVNGGPRAERRWRSLRAPQGGLQRLASSQILSFGVSSHSFGVVLISR